MNGIHYKLKEKAHGICRDYLQGRWADISLDEFSINVLSGGLSNELYICSLPEGRAVTDGTPQNVLLRIYGQLHGDLVSDVHALVSDTVIFALLAERNIAPKLYAIFPEGRLEQLLPARNLTLEELMIPAHSVKIAQQMAKLHKLELPVCKQPTWMWHTIARLLIDVDDIEFEEKDKALKLSQLKNINLHKEFSRLRTYIESLSADVVFCHNDIQEGNILKIPKENGKEDDSDFQLIDFEYSAYNYRSSDIANHFCEWLYDYTQSSPPYFKVNLENWPSRDQQLLFVRAYLKETATNQSDGCEPALKEETMLEEIEKLTLASHFLWGVWAIVQANVSNIKFGYLDYAMARFEAYQEHKKSLDLQWNMECRETEPWKMNRHRACAPATVCHASDM